MTRSIWKGPFLDISIKRTFVRYGLLRSNKIFVWSRRSMILPDFCGKQFYIYNGKKFIICRVSETMIGHKFGEFASTRKIPAHKHKQNPK